MVLVGDLFTKGPDPVGVYQQIREGGFEATLGNHDQRLLALREGDRHAANVRAALTAVEPGWLAWLASLPLFIEAAPFTVVHAGVHPLGSLEATTRQMALTMRRFPEGTGPFWWQDYAGQRRVIFGHDARRGLVRVEREGLPWLIGLDSGCVYGGRLSGYLVELDRLIQVPAKRVYQRPG